MSKTLVAKAIAGLREAAADAAWTQWAAIFTLAASRRSARAIVDPEALLLSSLALRDHEPRLWGAAAMWAEVGARLLSVQRTKNLALQFPSFVRARIGEFAQLAVKDGGDQRWRSLVGPPGTRAVRPKGRARRETPVVQGGPALMLRLRLGLGVGIKPDVLAYLIGIAGGANPVVLIARQTAYQARAVRRALEELVAAGFIEPRAWTPIAYRVDNAKWAGLLDFEPRHPPAWWSWPSTYAFVAAVDEWSRDLPESEVVLASEARDVMDKYGSRLDGAVRVPALMNKRRGPAYLTAFIQATDACREFFEAVV